MYTETIGEKNLRLKRAEEKALRNQPISFRQKVLQVLITPFGLLLIGIMFPFFISAMWINEGYKLWTRWFGVSWRFFKKSDHECGCGKDDYRVIHHGE